MRTFFSTFGSDSFFREHRRIYEDAGEAPPDFQDLLDAESFGDKKVDKNAEAMKDIKTSADMKAFVEKDLATMTGWDKIKDANQKTKIIENMVKNLINADGTPVAEASKILESMKNAIQDKLANEGFLRKSTDKVEQNDGTVVTETKFDDDLASKDVNPLFQRTETVNGKTMTVGKMDISYYEQEIIIRLNTGQEMTLDELVAYVQDEDECRVVDLLAVEQQLRATLKDIRYLQRNATGTFQIGPRKQRHSYSDLVAIQQRAKNPLAQQRAQAAINEIEQDYNMKEAQIESLKRALRDLNSNRRGRLSTHERDGTQKSENRLRRVTQERFGVKQRGIERASRMLLSPEFARIMQEERDEKERKAKEEAGLRLLKEWDRHRGASGQFSGLK